jgi:ATP-dependent Clp protease adaptor protein ClpS
MVKEKIKPLKEDFVNESIVKKLVLYNDDYNTFDFVIKTLVELCDHDEIQAEQCAIIAHYKGKCEVKFGTLEELKPIKVEMQNRNLTVEIK